MLKREVSVYWRSLFAAVLVISPLMLAMTTTAEARHNRNVVRGAAIGAGVGALVGGGRGAVVGGVTGSLIGAVSN